MAKPWQEQATEVTDRWAATLDDIEEMEVSPRREDVRVTFCGLAWVPVYRLTLPDGTSLDLPARPD